jgi:hypothetical protein
MSKFAERLRFLANGQDDPHSVALDEAADEIERHFNQVAALLEFAESLRKDAARYRWLRHIETGPAAIWDVVCDDTRQMTLKCGGDLDAAIDAAMKAP